MGTFSLLELACILSWAGMLTNGAVKQEFFPQGTELSWDEARDHCQVCFDDLVTLTPLNVQAVVYAASNLSSDAWIGLRKNPDNGSTEFWSQWANGEPLTFQNWYPGSPVLKSTNQSRDVCCSCSCSCISNPTPDQTTPTVTHSQSTPTPTYGPNTQTATENPYASTVTDDQDALSATYDQDALTATYGQDALTATYDQDAPTATYGQEAPTATYGQDALTATYGQDALTATYGQDALTATHGGDATTAAYGGDATTATHGRDATTATHGRDATTAAYGRDATTASHGQNAQHWSYGHSTSLGQTCPSPTLVPLSIPQPTADEDEDDEMEDSCVAMRSFGAWVEKNCSHRLPFICYEDIFFGQANATEVTNTSAKFTWERGPGPISHYTVKVEGGVDKLEFNETGRTMTVSKLTAGTNYSVLVFPIKCGRALQPREVAFYTVPNKIDFLNASNETGSSVSLRWSKPAGNVDFYLIKIHDQEIRVSTESAEITGLTPGSPHSVTVFSGVLDNVTYSEGYNDTVYTKPGKVSNIKVSENTQHSMLIGWQPPKGHARGYIVRATTSDGRVFHDNETSGTNVRVSGLPKGAMVTVSITAVASDTLIGEEVTTVSYTVPGPVSNLTLSTTNATLTARWLAPKGNYSHFNVTLCHSKQIVNVSETEVTFSKLKSAAEYTVEVRSVSGPFESALVNKTSYTLADPPTHPKVAHRNQSHITFEWNPPSNSESSLYWVSINSSFWQYSSNVNVTGKKSYTFGGLKSGTKYELQVRTRSGHHWSAPAVLSGAYTVEDKVEVSLSMLCSSETPLLCDKNATRQQVLKELDAHFGSFLGDSVFWKLEPAAG